MKALVVLCAMVVALTSCATQPTPSAYDPPGFWFGLLHGFLIVFSLIGSIFGDVRVYAFPNSGIGYDFGDVIGAAMFLGGSGAGARSHDERDA